MNFAERRHQVLRVVPRVIVQAAVAGADVEITIGAETELPALVVAVGSLVELQQLAFAGGVERAGGRIGFEFGNDRPVFTAPDLSSAGRGGAVRRGVVDVVGVHQPVL